MSLSSALHLWCSYSVRAKTESDRSKQKPEESLPVPTMCGPLDWTLPWMQVNGTKISCGNKWNCSWNTWLVKDQRSSTGYTEGLLNTTDAVWEITASGLSIEITKQARWKCFCDILDLNVHVQRNVYSWALEVINTIKFIPKYLCCIWYFLSEHLGSLKSFHSSSIYFLCPSVFPVKWGCSNSHAINIWKSNMLHTVQAGLETWEKSFDKS